MKALPVSIGLINFNTKATGERNAGNPHVAFEVAGAGNGAKKVTAPVLDPTGANSKMNLGKSMKNWGIRLIFFIFAALVVDCIFAEQNSFTIYFSEGRNANKDFLEGRTLQTLVLEKNPIITMDDVVAYYPKTYEIKLTNTACERLAETHCFMCPFVVCVNEERIYDGYLVGRASSAMFSGIGIEEEGCCNSWIEFPNPKDFKEYETWTQSYDRYKRRKQNIIRIQYGNHYENIFRGEDLRPDPRIFKAFKKAGKIRTRFSIPNRLAYTFWKIEYWIKSWFEFREAWEILIIALIAPVLMIIVIGRVRKKRRA